MGERKVWWYFWEYEVLKEEKMVVIWMTQGIGRKRIK